MAAKERRETDRLRTTGIGYSGWSAGFRKHLNTNGSRPLRVGGLLALALILINVTGCQLIPRTATEATLPGETTTLTGTGSQGAAPSTDPGTQPATSGAATAAQDTQPAKRPGEIALEKVQEARSGLTSEKMVHLWSVESSYPFKSGENTMEWNLDRQGQPTTGRGSLRETYAGKESLTRWYRGPDAFTVISGEETTSYPLEDVQEISRYDMGSLLQAVLLSYPVRQEGGYYLVRVTTQNEAEIQGHLEDLGYRKQEGAYAGNLFMEIILNASTGYLEVVNYEFSNSLEGYTDNGQITFSGWNEPVSYEPDDSVPAEDPEAGEEAPAGDTLPDSEEPALDTSPGSEEPALDTSSEPEGP